MNDTTIEADLTAGQDAIRITREALGFDCLALYYAIDEVYADRILAGGINATNVTFATETSWDKTLENIETGLERIEKSPNMAVARNVEEIQKARDRGRLAVIIGTQGAAMIERELWRVGLLARLGCRFLGLAYTPGNLFADGCGEERDAALTFLGREFVAAVNEQPMILDLSHSGHSARAEATELARAPVCTHSNAYAVNPNDRNTKDETVKAIVAKGGMIGACGLPTSVKPKNPTLSDLIDHIDHYTRLVGHEHVGIGLDFTEAYKESGHVLPESRRWRTLRPDIFGSVDDFLTQTYPTGIHSIRLLPNLTQGLLDRGYNEEQSKLILGGNWMRVFQNFVG